jgi:hypothetical protein
VCVCVYDGSGGEEGRQSDVRGVERFRDRGAGMEGKRWRGRWRGDKVSFSSLRGRWGDVESGGL